MPEGRYYPPAMAISPEAVDKGGGVAFAIFFHIAKNHVKCGKIL
jgi:hypothetical protein